MKITRQDDLEDADVETVDRGGGGEGEGFRMNTCTLFFFYGRLQWLFGGNFTMM